MQMSVWNDVTTLKQAKRFIHHICACTTPMVYKHWFIGNQCFKNDEGRFKEGINGVGSRIDLPFLQAQTRLICGSRIDNFSSLHLVPWVELHN